MQTLWLLILLGPALTCVHAADYPDKPVRFIVGFTPGGPSDIVARLLGQKLSELWKEQVIIDNRRRRRRQYRGRNNGEVAR
jgi:tripartite-type tricarboxylate transporter receptor subunit TctC